MRISIAFVARENLLYGSASHLDRSSRVDSLPGGGYDCPNSAGPYKGACRTWSWRCFGNSAVRPICGSDPKYRNTNNVWTRASERGLQRESLLCGGDGGPHGSIRLDSRGPAIGRTLSIPTRIHTGIGRFPEIWLRVLLAAVGSSPSRMGAQLSERTRVCWPYTGTHLARKLHGVTGSIQGFVHDLHDVFGKFRRTSQVRQWIRPQVGGILVY